MKDYIVGVDIGGTTIKLALFPVGEVAEAAWEVKTPKMENVDIIWQTIGDAIFAKMDEMGLDRSQLKAVGGGLPGPIRDDGYLPWCVNLGMKGCYPAQELEKVVGVPVKMGNDALVAALGEVYYGAAKGYENAVMFTLGTGVGGGVILNGQGVRGPHGVGGEVGHFVVNPDEEETCNCGNKGCLEQYASATGIVRVAKRILKKSDAASSLRAMENMSCKDICDEAKAGDQIAQETLEVFGKYLGLAISHVILTTDPSVIIIGGGVSRAGQILVDVVNKYIDMYSHIAEHRGDIVLATLGNDAGAYGAAALAQSLL